MADSLTTRPPLHLNYALKSGSLFNTALHREKGLNSSSIFILILSLSISKKMLSYCDSYIVVVVVDVVVMQKL